MQSRAIFISCFTALSMLGSLPALADETLCIRGKSFEPGREFLQTRRLNLHVEGPALEENLLLRVASRSAREKIWPQLKAEEVLVAVFDEQVCGNEPLAELTVQITQEDLTRIRQESTRGGSHQPQLTTVANRSVAKQAPPKSAPSGTPAGAKRHDWVHLYFATNREFTGNQSAQGAFSKNFTDKLTWGAVNVSIPYDHRWANLESPSIIRLEWDEDPERHVRLDDKYDILSASQIKMELTRKGSALDQGGVLLFIHGYNNSFSDAAKRAAQLAYDLAFPGATVLFSWPSAGETLAYASDGTNAGNSWRKMADVLKELTGLGPKVPIYIVAHSMGNRVFTQGLAALFRQYPGADKRLRQVILAAPDVGLEEFRQRWAHELQSATPPRYTLYASDHDKPVALSGSLNGGPRLGSGGKDITVLSGLDSIDASAITKEWFGLSHSYFGDNGTIMNDLFLLINEGLEPSKRPRLKKVKGTRGEYWEFKR